MTNQEMYLQFRKELDKICVPEILKCVEQIPIVRDGKTVGLMCVAHMTDWDYIDCLYILPKYRHQGIGANVVKSYWNEHNWKEMRLHIIHKNKPAKAFWDGIFNLLLIESNDIDGLYKIVGLKNGI